MYLKYLALLFPLALSAASTIDSSFSVDLTLLNYPQITADSQGNIVIGGFARSCALPVVQPLSHCGALWIGKLDPTGQTLLFATYLGDHAMPATGFASTAGFGIQTDPNGNIYMATSVTKTVLPTVNPIQSQVNGRASLYLLKLAADGSALLYATYLGGSNYEVPVSLAVDATGAAYILDTTNSSNFPSTPLTVTSKEYGRSALVKLTPDGSLAYSASFPWVYSLQPITVDAAGGVTLIAASNDQVLKLSPDATRLDTTPLPSWNKGFYNYPFASPTSDGGMWITGSVANGNVPVPANGLEPIAGPSPYMRVENGVASAPSRIPAHVVHDFAVDPGDATRIYAATDGGLFVSVDNGLTWTLLFSRSSTAVAVDPYDSNTLYVGVAIVRGGDPGFYRSTDGGLTWTPSDSPLLANYSVTSISADPHVPGLVYALGSGFFRSRDSGATWAAGALPASLGNGGTPSSVYYFVPQSVRADSTQANQVFVAGVDRCLGFCPVFPDVLRSQDAGVTVTKVPTQPGSNSSALRLSIDPASGDVYAVGGGQLMVYRAANSYAPESLATNVSTIAFDSANFGYFYEALGDGSILASIDGGATWNPLTQLATAPSELVVSAGGVLHANQSASTDDAYAIRYDAAGNILYGTFLSGGATVEKTSAITALDHLWIAGSTGTNLPLLNPVQATFGGRADGFLAEFDSDGTLLSSTYLGGAGKDEVDTIIPLSDGSVTVIGTTDSADFAKTLPGSALGAGKTFVLHLAR